MLQTESRSCHKYLWSVVATKRILFTLTEECVLSLYSLQTNSVSFNQHSVFPSSVYCFHLILVNKIQNYFQHLINNFVSYQSYTLTVSKFRPGISISIYYHIYNNYITALCINNFLTKYNMCLSFLLIMQYTGCL